MTDVLTARPEVGPYLTAEAEGAGGAKNRGFSEELSIARVGGAGTLGFGLLVMHERWQSILKPAQ